MTAETHWGGATRREPPALASCTCLGDCHSHLVLTFNLSVPARGNDAVTTRGVRDGVCVQVFDDDGMPLADKLGVNFAR